MDKKDMSAIDAEYVQKFALAVRRRMEYLEISQIEVSRRSGLTQCEVSTILRGKTAVRITTVRKLAIALAMRPSELMDF